MAITSGPGTLSCHRCWHLIGDMEHSFVGYRLCFYKGCNWTSRAAACMILARANWIYWGRKQGFNESAHASGLTFTEVRRHLSFVFRCSRPISRGRGWTILRYLRLVWPVVNPLDQWRAPPKRNLTWCWRQLLYSPTLPTEKSPANTVVSGQWQRLDNYDRNSM
jgi:hypothetical protein